MLIRLTRRGPEINDLARSGISNAEIAERMALSVRAIESHLYRAMTRLGPRDRRDLGQWTLVRSPGSHPPAAELEPAVRDLSSSRRL
ncbi:MAG TPA: helix-turn-helix transcriptional regulator [Solirubrobacteraceae bacterium]|nr:helix-turn-helix transcriptional regulator [Solirubrobacteraceae bacterium]